MDIIIPVLAITGLLSFSLMDSKDSQFPANKLAGLLKPIWPDH